MKTTWIFLTVAAMLSMSLAADEEDGEVESAPAVRMDQAVATLSERIEQARAELRAARRVTEEQARRIRNDLEREQSEIDALREAVASLRNRREALEIDSGKAERETRALEQSVASCRAAFLSLVHSVSLRLASVPRYGGKNSVLREQCRRVMEKPVTDGVDPMPFLNALDEEIRAGMRGEQGSGFALDRSGILREGVWLRWGPCRWFAAGDEPAIAGLLVPGEDAEFSTIAQGSKQETLAIRTLAGGQGGEMDLPLDVTGGGAWAHRTQARSSWLNEFQKGGPVMLPLALLGAVAFVVALCRAIVLGRLRIPDPEWAARLAGTAKLDEAEARRKISVMTWPAGPLLLQALKHRGDSPEKLEEILHEQILGEVPRLEKQLAWLAVLAGVAPLLGLLGTVTGMIHTFELVNLFGAGDVKILSGGISEALITTKTGLAIAIPTLLAHALLRRLSRRIIFRLEELAIAFIEEASSPS